MYTLSDVFLSHAACTSHASASSFWEVRFWVSVLSSSLDSSESHRVSLPVDLSSGTSNVTFFGCVGCSAIGSGLWSFLNRLMQMWVGCSPPHSSHRSGVFVSCLSTWLIWGPVSLLGRTPVNVRLAWGLVSLLSRVVGFLVCGFSSPPRTCFLNLAHSVVVIDLRKACILPIFVSVGFWLVACGQSLA